MVNEKRGIGKITYGSEEITITLINQKISEEDLNCFEGSEQRQNSERQFLFCNSQEGSSLLFKSKK